MNKYTNRQALIVIGHVFFLIYILFAILFYKERIIYADSAFNVFKIIHFKWYIIEAHRYSAVLAQSIPLAGVLLNLSLKCVLILYSISFPVVFYLCFIFVAHFLKDNVAGILLLLPLVVAIRYAYFYSMTETHQAIAFCTVFFAWINSTFYSRKVIYSITGCFISLVCLFTHPIAIFLLIFIIFYSAISNSALKFNYLLPFLVVISGFLLLKLKFTSSDSYEGSFFTNVLNSRSLFHSIKDFYPIEFLLTRSKKIYFLPFLIFLIGFIYFVKSKYYKQIVFVTGSIVVLAVVTIIAYYKGDADVQMEKDFMPVAYFAYFPFAYFISAGENVNFRKIILLPLVLIVGLSLICNTGKKYFEPRITYMTDILEATKVFPEQKIILEEKEVDPNSGITWSYPYETLVLSSLYSPNDSRTIFINSNHLDLSDTISRTCFLGAPFWIKWETEEFNPEYFHLVPGNYRYVDSLPDIKFN